MLFFKETLSSADFFFYLSFFEKNASSNITILQNSLNPIQVRRLVRPERGTKCLKFYKQRKPAGIVFKSFLRFTPWLINKSMKFLNGSTLVSFDLFSSPIEFQLSYIVPLFSDSVCRPHLLLCKTRLHREVFDWQCSIAINLGQQLLT